MRASQVTVRESQPVREASRRALIIAFALVPLNTLFLVRSVYRWNYSMWGPVYPNVVTLLFALVLLNMLLARCRPAWALRVGELLTVYVIVSMSTGLVGGTFSVGGSLPPVITGPFWYATDENNWRVLVWPYLPPWLTVRATIALEGFWSGETNPYQWAILRHWMVPALWWTSFTAAVMWVCLCLSSIVRRRWVDQERLPFPFVTVPLQLVEERFGLLRSKAWWIALTASFGLHVWNSIASLVPSLPAVPLSFNFTPYVLNRVFWQHFAELTASLSWQPWQIALCYLAPLDLLFSLFVFDLLWVFGYVVAQYLGYGGAQGAYPHFEQLSGGLVGLALGFLWCDRRYFAQVLRRAAGLRSTLRGEGEEAFSYRFALIGLVLGLLYCWWFWWRAGVPTWVLVAFFSLYFAYMMVISRVRSQVGGPIHEVWAAMPDTALRAGFGQVALGPHSVGMMGLLNFYLTGDQENNPIPLQLEAMKMAEGGRMERRRIAVALALVVPFTVLCYFWGYLHVGYAVGTGTAKTQQWLPWTGRWAAEPIASAVRQPAPMSVTGTIGMSAGMIVSLVLLFLKLRFLWWPLHPIAYPIANSWFIHEFTLVIFFTWLVKAVILRYGGLRAHRVALPVFLGLLVGDFTSRVLINVVVLTFNLPG